MRLSIIYFVLITSLVLIAMSFFSLAHTNKYSVVAIKDNDHIVGLVLDGDKPADGVSVIAGNTTNVTHDGFFYLPYHRNFTVKSPFLSKTFSLSNGNSLYVIKVYAAFNDSKGTVAVVTKGDPLTLFVVTNESKAVVDECDSGFVEHSSSTFSVSLCNDVREVKVDNLTINVGYFDLVLYQSVRLLGPFPLLVPLLVFLTSYATDSKVKIVPTIIGSITPTLSALFPLILFNIGYAKVFTIEVLVLETQLSSVMSLLPSKLKFMSTILATALISLFALVPSFAIFNMNQAYLLIPGMIYFFPVNAVNLELAVLSVIPWILIYFSLEMFKGTRKRA
ncbi:hypothetical protein [Sulfuracidifex tepidarius]|uniref:Uncharacterized protein n=1 Tax=Sulfuracidifex tepidarius TaxID=1294262 RepID=A0A510E0U7_9CREN|nr:hypothetical protein [Sulfuracidifex tepidarius]BBG25810.1 hypothetical protein IC007_0315 [Sulfuracidifex tepidarius]